MWTAEFKWFVGLLPPYAFVWLPSIYAYAWLVEKGNEDKDDTHVAPPRFVWVSVAILFVLFLLFPAAYGINLLRPLPQSPGELVTREKLYTIASMIAKVSLHAILGFSVIGQSAALDAVVNQRNNTTKIRNTPRDDADTLRNIILAVVASIAVLSLGTVWLLKATKDAKVALRRLHASAAMVHILSATVILTVALSETGGNLKRYQAKPDLNLFLKPEPWMAQCYNETTNVLEPTPAAKCPGSDNVAVYTNSHRGKGKGINIALLAFAFAFWSGVCHFWSRHIVCNANWRDLRSLAAHLALLRWIDYGLSAPLMILTLNVIFAATNLAGVVVSPLLLLLLLGLAAYNELSVLWPPAWWLQTLVVRYNALLL